MPVAESPSKEYTLPSHGAALAYEVTQKEAKESSPQKSPKKTKPSHHVKKPKKPKKTPDEILFEMTQAGDPPEEIARALSVSREEVILRQSLGKFGKK